MPIWTLFDDHPTVSVYEAVTPDQPLDELNASHAFGQFESDQMNFAEVDRAPFPEFNRILWHDAKGLDVPYPETHNNRVALAVRGEGDQDDD